MFTDFILQEQFCPDWDYIPVDRDGDNIVNEPVAGNFDSHTNVWQSALVSPPSVYVIPFHFLLNHQLGVEAADEYNDWLE